MKTERFRSNFIGEEYSVTTLDNGLKIYVLEKPDYASAYAIFGTKYGSIDVCFRAGDSGEFTRVPEGIAHFLEHKLFESEEGDAFQKFAETGAYANAFTSFDRTGYLFSCTDEFDRNLHNLLDFVSHPYFTEETVNKEQGIIGQEIKMYDDSPEWRVFFNLLSAVYHNDPVRIDIAGTVESIAQITPELLYKCYNTFYSPSNMFLCIAGNVRTDDIVKAAERDIKAAAPLKIESMTPKEPESVRERLIEQKLDVAQPLFALGYKLDVPSTVTPEMRIKIEIMLELAAGRSSGLYNQLVEEKLINPEFSFEHFTGRSYSVIIFSGESDQPAVAAERIKAEIERLKTDGFDREELERIRRKCFGQTVMMFNSNEGLASALFECAIRNERLFDFEKAYGEITLEDMNALIKILDDGRTSLSIINPVG